MFFRNLTMFRFPRMLDLTGLPEGIAGLQLKPVGPLELSSRGFVSPFGRDSDILHRQIGTAIWISVASEDKILPGAVVANAVAEKLAEVEKAEGRKLGGRARKRLKEDLVHELLPRAFVKPSRTDAMIDFDLGIIAVDTSSRKAAEAIVSDIRHAIGSFPALPLNAELAPRAVLTGWIAGDSLPESLAIGDEAELREPTDHGAVVKLQRQELQGDEVGRHLEAGKQCTRLALTMNDHLSFVLGEDLIIRKLKFLDAAIDSLGDGDDRQDLQAELDARFALMAGELRVLFAALAPALKLSEAT